MIKSLTSGREFIFPEQFSVDKSTALCFTGHREKNIPPYNELYKYKNLTLEALKLLMSRYIDIAIECGYTSFISGFAEGFDLWAAHHVIKRKNDGAGISLIGAVPYLHHADRFSSKSLALLKGQNCMLTNWCLFARILMLYTAFHRYHQISQRRFIVTEITLWQTIHQR